MAYKKLKLWFDHLPERYFERQLRNRIKAGD